MTEHHRRARRQERRGDHDYGGKLTTGSGSGWVRKGDRRTDCELIEYKTTTAKGFYLTHDALRTAQMQAFIDGWMPVFEIEFDGRGTWVILDKQDYLDMRPS